MYILCETKGKNFKVDPKKNNLPKIGRFISSPAHVHPQAGATETGSAIVGHECLKVSECLSYMTIQKKAAPACREKDFVFGADWNSKL